MKQKQLTTIIVFANYNCFRIINLSRSLFDEINIMRQLPQWQVFYVKNYDTRGDLERELLILSLIYSNKLAYLQRITVLVYRKSPPKSHEKGYLNQTFRKICKNEFVFKTCSFTKKKLLLRYFSRILFKSFRILLLQNTSSHICSNSKQVVHALFKIIKNYVDSKISNQKFLVS